MNLILAIGKWVLEEACRFSARMYNRQGIFQSISVNISMRQLEQSDLIEQVGEALRQTGVPADVLQLEITESILMTDVEKSIAALSALRVLGVGISLDDFGTGYSSFTYLAKLPITTLKIDKSMVDELVADSPNNSFLLVESLLYMAKILGYKVVAEGVEKPEQLQLLKKMGCSHCQGYFLGRPLPEQEAAINCN